ncbi:hypothetical protein N0V82_004399 [Gnomoniopsis sp. IMI 355080]|nr:hypothetical protein N0V82_004399 [Gnomoniopsis sp. IMI 355080]
MQTNLELRAVLDQPLRLASAIFQTHPIFTHLGSIYNLRMVPWRRDGRSVDEYSREGGYTSVWYPGDGDGHLMYGAAQRLFNSGLFDESVARAAIGSILDHCLRFSIVNGPHESFTECDDRDGEAEIRICLDAKLIWPLLVDEYSESEKTAHRFYFAQRLCHEMARCGQALHPEVWNDLLALGDEMFGARQPIATSLLTKTLQSQGLLPDDPKNPGQTLPYDGRYRGDWFRSNDFFMRDASQGHDGKSFENEPPYGAMDAWDGLSSAAWSRPCHSRTVLEVSYLRSRVGQDFRRRLFYDRANWEKKFTHLYSLVENTRLWYQGLDQVILFRLGPQYSFQAVDSVAVELEVLNQNARSTVGVLNEMVRAVAQECAYAAHMEQLMMRQDAASHHGIYMRYIGTLQSSFGILRRRISSLVDLITVSAPMPDNTMVRWDVAIQQKVKSDYSASSGSKARRRAMKAALMKEGADFGSELDEIEVQRTRLQALMDYMDYIWANEAQTAIRRAHRQPTPLRRILPAAIRELRRLDLQKPAAATAARNVARRWLSLVGFHVDLQDPSRSVRRAQRKMNPDTRRSDLLTEARSLLQNEAVNRQQQALDGSAAGVRENRTVNQIREAIRALASQPYKLVDENFLMHYFTDERIQMALDANLGEDELQQGLMEAEEGLYRTIGL